MTERTLEQALNRADGLRMITEFREDYSNASDQDDIVLLADEVLCLREERESLLKQIRKVIDERPQVQMVDPLWVERQRTKSRA